MGNLIPSYAPEQDSTKKRPNNDCSEFESNVKKQRHVNDTNHPPYRIMVEDLFEFRIDHPQERVDTTWWKTIASKVRKDLLNKQSIFKEYDEKCANLIVKALQSYNLSKTDISVCPFDYGSIPTIKKNMIFSLEKGPIIPANKYELPLKHFKVFKSSNYHQVSVFQSICGSGKTHFSNVITQELDKFCFLISPVLNVYSFLESHVQWMFLEREVSRERLDRICDLFIMSHIIFLLMVLEGNNKISKRDFLLFQKNGGNMHIKEIFQCLLNFGDAKLNLLKDIDITWCIDEAHIISSVLKRRVPHKTGSQTEMGSLLTSLNGTCRKYGPTFLTSILTGLITEIKSDISNIYSLKQKEKEFSLPILGPIDSQQMLSQVMNFPVLSNNEIASFVCNQLMGPPRLTVSFFNMLVYEANKKNSSNVEALLLKSLYKTLKVIHVNNRNYLPVAKRYSNWKKSYIWDPMFDQLILFGSATTKQMPSRELFEKLIHHGVCFDLHKSSNQIFLATIDDKVQVIDQMRVDGDWLKTLWNVAATVLEREKLAELLLTHMLIESFDDCIGVVLKGHPIFKHYTLMSNYWFHDVPFSKETTDKNINRKSTLLIKLISSHFKTRTYSMKDWNNSNAKWLSDLPPNSITFYPNSHLSPVDFVIHPTTEAGPDLIGVLVRNDYAQFLSQTQPVEWIENDENLPPYIPIVASCTIERDGEKLKNKIQSTSLANMYNSSNNELAKQERILIEKDVKTTSPYTVRVVFAPIAEESLSTILSETLPIENIKETEDDGVIIMFSKHLSSFENYLKNETVNQIIQFSN